MQEHALTVKARSLMLRVAALDVELLETLALIFATQIYLDEGYQSIPDYCVRGLGMSEDSAMRRRKAAELLARYPLVVKPLLQQNKLHLSAIAMLHPIITDANAERLLTEACGKRIYEIETMIVSERPKPLINPGVFTNFNQAGLPSLSPTASLQQSAKEEGVSFCAVPPKNPLPQAPRVKPLQVNVHHFQFMGDDAMFAIYNEVRDLEPGAEANELFRRAMTSLRDELMRRKRGALKKTRAAGHGLLRDDQRVAAAGDVGAATFVRDEVGTADSATLRNGDATESDEEDGPGAGRDGGERLVRASGTGEWVGSTRDKRYISAPLRREVYARDNYCCQYSSKGRQCCSRRWLHLHHVIAWAKGGRTEASNLKVFCSAHNWYAGEQEFGKRRDQDPQSAEVTKSPHNAGAALKQSPAIADSR